MNNGGDSFSVTIVEKVIVCAEEPCADHWLPLSNFDLLVPPIDVGSIFFYQKPSHGSFPDIVKTLKQSLSRALALFPILSGKIAWNVDVGENQIHCNNQGADFIEAVADVELKEINLYKPDECVEGKLTPKKLVRGVLAIQVTKLKCEGIVIGIVLDHRIVDGHSANMFYASWAELNRSKTPSIFPSFGRSYLKPRSPTSYSPLIDDVFAPFVPPSNPGNDLINEDIDSVLVNRVYYIKGEQLKRIQGMANENGCRRSKLVAFTSFIWQKVALSMDDSGKHDEACNVVIVVEGRGRMSQGDGEEKEKLLASHFGNVLSMPYGSKKAHELKDMPLCDVATLVYEFLQPATTKEHFLDIIDWVEEQRPRPLISKAFAGGEMSFTVSAGQRFENMDENDFGWGKVTLGTCHVPTERRDCFVMTLGSPINNEDWVVYTHLPRKHTNYIEQHASDVFKPMNANYLNI